MGRKTEQEIIIDGQIRFWEGKLRKSRTTSQQLEIAKVLKDLRAERWPSPIDEAVAVAKAAKLQMKAQRVSAAQAKEAEVTELERLKEIERQKIRDEENPVIDHVKRAIIRAEMREETTAMVPDITPSVETTTSDANPQPPGGAVVSPELTTITLEAEASANRQSSIRRDDEGITPPQTSLAVLSPGLLDMFKAVHRLSDADEHDGSVGMTNALLHDFEHAPEPHEAVGEGGYMSDGMGHVKRG